MKQREIDRWMRHQAHVGNQAAVVKALTMNWARIASVLIVVGALVFIVLRVAGVL